ncbi:hypothetical protein [Streptomyces sp. NPDC056296]|uniref:hypothetical protein n=1 Tax=Streptomyces sp. NPDC056296 TaxID=3345775 RepID=UPI0035E0FECB
MVLMVSCVVFCIAHTAPEILDCPHRTAVSSGRYTPLDASGTVNAAVAATTLGIPAVAMNIGGTESANEPFPGAFAAAQPALNTYAVDLVRDIVHLRSTGFPIP